MAVEKTNRSTVNAHRIWGTAPDGSMSEATTDGAGNLNVNVQVGGGGGGSNASVGATGAPAPTSATEVGSIDGSGNLQGASTANPIPVNVISGGGSNASVGLTGATAPTSATEIGVIDGTGKLQGASASNPVRVDPTGTTIQPVSGTVAISGTVPVSGTVTDNQGTAAANTAGWPVTSGGVAEVTAAWTSATTINTALQIATAGMSTVALYLSESGSVTGGVLTFEVSDTVGFTNAYPILGAKIGTAGAPNANTPPVATIALSGLANTVLIFNVSGILFFRARLSTVITGAGTLNISETASMIAPAVGGGIQSNVTGSIILSQSVVGATSPADNLASNSIFTTSTSSAFPLSVADAVYGGAFAGAADATRQGWSKRRTPTVFKTAQATASGNTAVWTPGTGNKFRLLRVFVELTDNASLAAGAVLTISLQDAASAMPIAFDVFVPTTAVTTTVGVGLEQELDLGEFGIPSAAANNALNVNLSAALVTGNVRVIAMGTEE